MEAVLAGSFLDELPERLIGDKAYDSDALDQTLAEKYGVEMISPNRSNRKQKTQDGRPLRRYRRRWKIEPLRVQKLIMEPKPLICRLAISCCGWDFSPM